MVERRPRLEGKVAIVTGAGSRGPGIGNGKATAILFAREGAKVLLVDMYPERMNDTLEMINSDGGEASIFAGDVTKVDDCQAMVKTERTEVIARNETQTTSKIHTCHNSGSRSLGKYNCFCASK